MNGSPIEDYHFQPSLATITYTLGFEMRQAAASAGLTFADFLALPGDPLFTTDECPVSKCDVLLWYRMSQRLAAVPQDLQARELARQNRTRGR